jgi:hypothetical protein
MRKVRSAKSNLNIPRTGSGSVHVQGMWRKTKDVVIADRYDNRSAETGEPLT